MGGYSFISKTLLDDMLAYYRAPKRRHACHWLLLSRIQLRCRRHAERRPRAALASR